MQKLACDALQELRIEHRREAINEETNEMEKARLEWRKYRARKYRNGETRKELLFRSRLLLFKDPAVWSLNQRKRAPVLFELNPDISKAFSLVQRLRRIYSSCKSVAGARLKHALWYNQVNEAGFHSFNSVAASVFAHGGRILNFFNNRSTNASAESFNAKLKDFRAQFRGVLDIKFFLFRVAKIFA
ncbi:MAG: transposase [Butyricimonas faecihominis]